MKPETCIVCGTVTQDGLRASWGPITVYFHSPCDVAYHDFVAPRLRDALQRAITRWYSQQRRTYP